MAPAVSLQGDVVSGTKTLPGDLPGLLRRGSPITMQTGAGPRPGVVMRHLPDGEVMIAWTGQDDGEEFDTSDPLPPRALALDLNDPTGRVHAAWWIRRNAPRDADYDMPCYPSTASYDAGEAARHAVYLATDGDDMTPDEIDTLRRACLAVAGRT